MQRTSEIPDLSVTISLDGPQKWHDLYRKNQGGQGSFQRTIEGLRHLVEAFGYELLKRIFCLVWYMHRHIQRSV